MAFDPFRSVSDAVKKAGKTVASSVTGAATTMLHVGSGVAQSGGHFVSDVFHYAVKDAEKELDAAGQEIQSVISSGQEIALKSLAARKIQGYAGIIKSLVKAWPQVLSILGSDVDVLRHEASQRGMSPKVVKAMRRIAASPELREPLSDAAGKSIRSFAVEFGGNVAAVESVNGALGFVAELQKIANVRRYGSVGLSFGASVGASGNLALGLYTSSPEDYRGPFIAVTLQGVIEIGGGVAVSFDLPDLRFGGFAIPVSVGEEFNISVGGGYTFMIP
ncbi:MAG TPA: hypothetical protein VFG09_01940 [Thermodesulfovibrionales bacterium]|nr:hypothetical protein [Thermodesulfovibrionales bacterium]